MKKKKEVPMPKLEQKKSLKKSWFVATGIAIVLALGVSFVARKQTKVEYVEKGVVNNYVCQILEFDNEQQLLAVRCMTK